MDKVVVLRGPEQIREVVERVALLPFDPLHEVIIREHSYNRSIAQNRLYWKWLTLLAADYGDSKEERAEYYKEKFLVNIFQRDDEGYAEMIMAIFQVEHDADQRTLWRQVIKLTSTTQASVKQMHEYLTEIDRHAASIGVGLIRDDLYKEAMGRDYKEEK